MRTVMLLATLVFVASCSSADPMTSAAPSAPQQESSAPLSSPSPSPTPTPSPTVEPSPSAGECTSDIRSGIEQTIRSQQEAFTRSDFAAARGFATTGFQASVSEEQFQLIIEGQYAFLLSDPAIEFAECVNIGDVAEILVRMGTGPRTDLRYQMLREQVGWRIEGASVVEVKDEIAV